MNKVFIVNGSGQYQALFRNAGWEFASSVHEASLVCFTGGEDVSPQLYNATAHRTTFNHMPRDLEEKAIFEQARAAGIPMVGICRGGQFLNVMSGGQMYQHVSNHGLAHAIVDVETGETIQVTSTHHQMMKPGIMGAIIAIATIPSSREWYEGEVFKRDESNTGIEVVHYTNTRCLCFQPHPEMYVASDTYKPMRDYFFQCLEKHLGI